MSDYESRKTLGIIVECAKLTPEIFAQALEDMIKNISNKQPQEKTTLGRLMKTGKVDSIEISGSNIGSFAKTARKYSLTYALKRIQDEDGKKQYLVCFHGKDQETMQRAFREHIQEFNGFRKKETLFSRKKVAAINVSAPEKDNEIGRDKHKERNKERSGRSERER